MSMCAAFVMPTALRNVSQPAGTAYRSVGFRTMSLRRGPCLLARPRFSTQSSPPKRQSVSVRAQSSEPVAESNKWPVIWTALNDMQLTSLPPGEAMRMITAGEAVLVDVRLQKDYEKCHALDAISVPLFQSVDIFNTDAKGVMRFFVYGLNGVGAVEPNPTFKEDLAQAVGEKAVILHCEAGGSIEPTPNFLYGRESRSLRAAYKVSLGNPTKQIYHLDGGLYRWVQEGFEVLGTYDTENLYKTPNAAAKATVFDTDK